MASRTLITLVDDIDGREVGPDGRTLTFSFDGVDYQIDLGAKNLGKFEKAIGPYLEAATRVGGRKGRGKAPSNQSSSDSQSRAIRDWARANGYDVSDRGRLSATVREAWEATL